MSCVSWRRPSTIQCYQFSNAGQEVALGTQGIGKQDVLEDRLKLYQGVPHKDLHSDKCVREATKRRLGVNLLRISQKEA